MVSIKKDRRTVLYRAPVCCLLQIEGLAGLYAVGLFVCHKPHRNPSGIVHLGFVHIENKRCICRKIVVDFDVGGVPNRIVTADTVADLFQMIPVLVHIEFVAVTLHIK